LLFIFLTSCGITGKKKLSIVEIPIQRVDYLKGDFSFKDDWSYPEGVYRNEFGQLSCDGICPEEIYSMIDESGKIYEDSLESFYHWVDTTHLFHSIQSEAWVYEWAGTDYINVERINEDTVICFTENNAATHSSLHLIITKDAVRPTIVLNSIVSNLNTDSNIKTYNAQSGQMIIDQKMWEKGILKAVFDFKFDDPEDAKNNIYWKGEIYATVVLMIKCCNVGLKARRHESTNGFFCFFFAPSRLFAFAPINR